MSLLPVAGFMCEFEKMSHVKDLKKRITVFWKDITKNYLCDLNYVVW